MCVFHAGHSVMANITGFLPYFYVLAPRGYNESDSFAFTEYLNVSGLPICIHADAQVSRVSAELV